MNNYCVYWIHYNTFTDPYNEGYIGITNNINRRLSEHIKSRNLQLKEALVHDATYTILHADLNYNEACEHEYNYRPRKNIGWNISAGGNIPPCQKGSIRSEETRQRMSAWQIGIKHTPERRAKNSLSHLGKKLGPQTVEHISKRIEARLQTYPSHSIQARQKISAALKGKKRASFSEETKRKMSEAARKPKEKVVCAVCSRLISKNNLPRHRCLEVI